jgi:hypothetical protein
MLPSELSQLLDRAKSLINTDGDLPAEVRADIHDLMEAMSQKEHVDAGYLRRARLGLICALRAIEHLRPEKDVYARAVAVIGKANRALQGTEDLKQLEKENGRLHAAVLDLMNPEGTGLQAIYAGMACFAAVNTVLYDGRLESQRESELKVPPDEWPACFYSCIAEAGSASWEEKGGSSERATYWNWYLSDAVPKAWDVRIEIEVR